MTSITTARGIFPETFTRHFKKNILATAITLTLGTAASTSSAALSSGDALQFVLGTVQTIACSYGPTPPCVIAPFFITDIVGSYFGVDTNANGIDPNEKTPIESLNGIVIGVHQPASGSHSGAVDGTERPNIDKPWVFFGGTGMHQTTTAITVLSGAGNAWFLDMSGWNWTWNEITSIPMVQVGDAVVSCDASCSFGENYTLDAAFHINGAGFTTVPYSLHLEGSIVTPLPLPPSVDIDIAGGSTQECDAPGGNNVSMSATVFTPEQGDVASITWFLDEVLVGEGVAIEVFVPLGAHTIKVVLDTTQSGNAEESAAIVVQDSEAPEITLGFIDAKTGNLITSTSGKGNLKVKILAEATDLCDPNPVLNATVGSPTRDDDVVSINRTRKKSSIVLSGSLGNDVLELRVQSEDASGNASNKTTKLNIN